MVLDSFYFTIQFFLRYDTVTDETGLAKSQQRLHRRPPYHLWHVIITPQYLVLFGYQSVASRLHPLKVYQATRMVAANTSACLRYKMCAVMVVLQFNTMLRLLVFLGTRSCIVDAYIKPRDFQLQRIRLEKQAYGSL